MQRFFFDTLSILLLTFKVMKILSVLNLASNVKEIVSSHDDV